ncbi:MAG: hypothetical protein NVSMB64_08860 [Candidatus Velthaea sp.]
MLRFVLHTEDPALDALAARLAALENGEGAPPVVAAQPAPAPPPARSPAPLGAPEPVSVPRPAPQAKPDAAAPVAAAAAVTDLNLVKVRSLWTNVRMRAEGEKPSLRASLSRATVDALDGDTLTLRAPDPNNAELLRANVATIRKAIDGVIGRPLDLRIIVDTGRNASAPDPETPTADREDLMRYAIKKLT